MFLSLILCLGIITGCDGENNSSSTSDVVESTSTTSTSEESTSVSTELNTEITDQTKLNSSIIADAENSVFFTTRVGHATVVSFVDGDTTKFRDSGDNYFSLRYYGVNTPESTGQIDPWGKAASNFTKAQLTGVNDIILYLEDQDTVGDFLDSSGGRPLGLVWYQPNAGDDYRCLNLELVELAYSRNQLFTNASAFRTVFAQASDKAEATGRRVYGEDDPTYDYSNTVYTESVYTITNNYDQYGVTEEHSNGVQLRMEVLITEMVGDNCFVRDPEPIEVDDGQGGYKEVYGSIYMYAGYNTSFASIVYPGIVLKVYCTLTTYNGNYQLTNLVVASIGSKKIQIMNELDSNNQPILHSVEPEILNYSDNLETKLGVFAQADVTVTHVGNTSESGAYTIYGVFEGTQKEINIRHDASLTSQNAYDKSMFIVGHTYTIIGGVLKYVYVSGEDVDSQVTTDSYQLNLGNKFHRVGGVNVSNGTYVVDKSLQS